MRKNVWVTLITLITLSFGYPLSIYSDIITKDGLKIQFFRKGEKKSISNDDLLSSEGISSTQHNLLDKLVLTKVKNSHLLSIQIYDCKNELVIRKNEIHIHDIKKSYTFQLYPWLDDNYNYPDEDLSNILGSNGVDLYRIVITNKSTNEKLLDLSYSISLDFSDK